MALTVQAWKTRAHKTNDQLADDLGICVRSLIRYLNGERPWPFSVIRTLKKISRNRLTDESFETSQGSRAA